ncbi:MAG: ABC transporter substrate-binding protein [Desulfobacteraceae bacterium]|nr:ABC transporter substrate-binding protein [Desulfobacteraceae bacterium]
MIPPVRKVRFLWRCVLLFLVALIPQWGFAAGSTPLGVIQAGTERALSILRASQKGEAPALRERRNEILNIVDEYFNFDEMGKRALGRPWKEQPPEKQKEFTRLFKQLLFNTYINRVETYTGSNEKISYDSEKIEGQYALVKTHAVLQDGKSVDINYRMQQAGGTWKVYDVVVEGISFVENYRSQFASILANGSFDTLLQKISEKVKQSS